MSVHAGKSETVMVYPYAITIMNEGVALVPMNCADAARSRQNSGMITILCDCSPTTVNVAIGAIKISMANT